MDAVKAALAPSRLAVTEQADANKVVVESKMDVDAAFAGVQEWPFQLRVEELCKLSDFMEQEGATS